MAVLSWHQLYASHGGVLQSFCLWAYPADFWGTALRVVQIAAAILLLIVIVWAGVSTAKWWREIHRPKCSICGQKRADDSFLVCGQCGGLFCPESPRPSAKMLVRPDYSAEALRIVRYSCGATVQRQPAGSFPTVAVCNHCLDKNNGKVRLPF